MGAERGGAAKGEGRRSWMLRRPGSRISSHSSSLKSPSEVSSTERMFTSRGSSVEDAGCFLAR